MFMSHQELIELTDFKAPHAQCRWLTEHDYPFDKSASGKPKVLKSYLEQRLGYQNSIVTGQQPDFSAIL